MPHGWEARVSRWAAWHARLEAWTSRRAWNEWFCACLAHARDIPVVAIPVDPMGRKIFAFALDWLRTIETRSRFLVAGIRRCIALAARRTSVCSSECGCRCTGRFEDPWVAITRHGLSWRAQLQRSVELHPSRRPFLRIAPGLGARIGEDRRRCQDRLGPIHSQCLSLRAGLQGGVGVSLCGFSPWCPCSCCCNWILIRPDGLRDRHCLDNAFWLFNERGNDWHEKE